MKAVGAPGSISISAESRSVQRLDGWDITVSLQAYGLRATNYGAAIASGLID